MHHSIHMKFSSRLPSAQPLSHLLRQQPSGQGNKDMWVRPYTFEVLSSFNRFKKSKESTRQSPEGAVLLVHPVELILAHILKQAMAVPLPRQLK